MDGEDEEEGATVLFKISFVFAFFRFFWMKRREILYFSGGRIEHIENCRFSKRIFLTQTRVTSLPVRVSETKQFKIMPETIFSFRKTTQKLQQEN